MRVGVTAAAGTDGTADAIRAEELGFDLYACGEHLFFHGPTPHSLIRLAAAAGSTTSIGLLSSVTVAPLYPSALLAKIVAALDEASAGRFELGVGAGGEYPPEFEAVGVPVDERFARLEESLQVLRILFASERASFDGRFTAFRDLTLYPRPVNDGGPAIWMGGRGPRSLRRAATYADVWIPYMVTPERLQSGLAEIADLAETAGRVRPPAGAVLLWTLVDDDGDRAREIGTRIVSETYAQDFAGMASKYLVLGNADQVVDRLHQFKEAGAANVVLQIAADEPARREASVEMLASEVLPALRG